MRVSQQNILMQTRHVNSLLFIYLFFNYYSKAWHYTRYLKSVFIFLLRRIIANVDMQNIRESFICFLSQIIIIRNL